jgi:hypothetical protein
VTTTQRPDDQRPNDDVPLIDVEERDQPIAIAGQRLTVVRQYKQLPDTVGPAARALAAIEIVDETNTVMYHTAVPYAVEAGGFSEGCSIEVQPLQGSNGHGLLLTTSCGSCAPLAGGPWQILGLIDGQLVAVGRPLMTEGEFGAFVPGAVNRIGRVTQILADTLTVRVWTGYFFATVPLRIDWLHHTLALAQRCFYQTGHGPAEEGCDGPVDGAERSPTTADLTFIRLFVEARETSPTPEHVVVKPDSNVTFLAGKVRVTATEDQNGIHLGVSDDLWLKVRVDDHEGWIHTDEDFSALGLHQSG